MIIFHRPAMDSDLFSACLCIGADSMGRVWKIRWRRERDSRFFLIYGIGATIFLDFSETTADSTPASWTLKRTMRICLISYLLT